MDSSRHFESPSGRLQTKIREEGELRSGGETMAPVAGKPHFISEGSQIAASRGKLAFSRSSLPFNCMQTIQSALAIENVRWIGCQ